ncbi:unnamed protein product [Vitrella brassicaformis CCMP3155]|uniref:Kinesin motor domain-containing protein n=3 Tax=Vitrella brassicaformis TaxID=1169539 RepID=A0A0G4ER73_VITBC|nr:unnamed protein product [Vitrella brassicaformis CCMP3155]|eukprot:CEL99952.1 unnamed protein product [Vitrella brassicaformis CCMP3155]
MFARPLNQRLPPPRTDLGTSRTLSRVRSRPSSDVPIANGGEKSVVVRVKPLDDDDHQSACITVPDGECKDSLLCQRGTLIQEYRFSRVFGPWEDNLLVFDQLNCTDKIAGLFHGYRETVMAYGQTGSGKTHTIFGTDNELGLLQYFIQSLFDKKAEEEQKAETWRRRVRLCCFEIYGDTLTDLIPPVHDDEGVEVSRGEFYLKTSRFPYQVVSVNSPYAALDMLEDACVKRKVGLSSLNVRSSRSHAIVQLFVETYLQDKSVLLGCLTLVDLAGSEKEYENPTAEGRSSARVLNNSLSSLNRLLRKMQEGSLKESDRRQSVLTRVLYDFLQKDTGLCMVFCLNAGLQQRAASLSTLAMASDSRLIQHTRRQQYIHIDRTLIRLNTNNRAAALRPFPYQPRPDTHAVPDLSMLPPSRRSSSQPPGARPVAVRRACNGAPAAAAAAAVEEPLDQQQQQEQQQEAKDALLREYQRRVEEAESRAEWLHRGSVKYLQTVQNKYEKREERLKRLIEEKEHGQRVLEDENATLRSQLSGPPSQAPSRHPGSSPLLTIPPPSSLCQHPMVPPPPPPHSLDGPQPPPQERRPRERRLTPTASDNEGVEVGESRTATPTPTPSTADGAGVGVSGGPHDVQAQLDFWRRRAQIFEEELHTRTAVLRQLQSTVGMLGCGVGAGVGMGLGRRVRDNVISFDESLEEIRRQIDRERIEMSADLQRFSLSAIRDLKLQMEHQLRTISDAMQSLHDQATHLLPTSQPPTTPSSSPCARSLASSKSQSFIATVKRRPLGGSALDMVPFKLHEQPQEQQEEDGAGGGDEAVVGGVPSVCELVDLGKTVGSEMATPREGRDDHSPDAAPPPYAAPVAVSPSSFDGVEGESSREALTEAVRQRVEGIGTEDDTRLPTLACSKAGVGGLSDTTNEAAPLCVKERPSRRESVRSVSNDSEISFLSSA